MYSHDCSGHPAVLVNCIIYGFIVNYDKSEFEERAVASTDVVRMLNEKKTRMQQLHILYSHFKKFRKIYTIKNTKL